LAIIKGINIETSITTFILLTGGLAFAGSLLSGSKIYSALNAFLVAPITTLHHLLATGWVSGIFEAKLRHVSMDDAVKVSKV